MPSTSIKENELAQIDQAPKVAPKKKSVKELREGAGDPPFITDMGHSNAFKNHDGSEIKMPRYAVWKHHEGKGKHQVAEVHDDLEYLIKKHKVNDKHVVKLGERRKTVKETLELAEWTFLRRKGEEKGEQKPAWDGNERRVGPRRKSKHVATNWGDRRKSNIKEDAAVNAAGAGAVAAIGTTKAGNPVNFAEPSPSKTTMHRRKFMGMNVFKVKTEHFMKLREGKRHYARYEDYVGSDEMGQAIREWGNKNYGKPIIVEDENTGMMTFLRYGGQIPR